MTQTQEQIEKLKTLQESLDWTIDLAENQLPELKSALLEVKDKIDNIQLPEIDTTELAKQGENPEATNSKILDEVQKILFRAVKYDEQTGNLIIENVELIIE